MHHSQTLTFCLLLIDAKITDCLNLSASEHMCGHSETQSRFHMNMQLNAPCLAAALRNWLLVPLHSIPCLGCAGQFELTRMHARLLTQCYNLPPCASLLVRNGPLHSSRLAGARQNLPLHPSALQMFTSA